MRPDLSVIIPTFRRPVELAEAIKSVGRQTGASTEIIVVDDCAEGSARAVVDRFPELPVSYHRMKTPSGGRPALARNVGWRQARGALVHFLDDDDHVPEGHYAAVKSAFEAAPSVGVVFGRVDPFATAGAALADETAYFSCAARRARLCRHLGSTLGFAAQMFFRPTLLVCGAATIRRDCLPELGGFDEELALVEDVDFYARAIRRFGACFIDRTTLRYRIGPSLMHRPGQAGAIRDCYRRMHARYRAQHGPLDFYALKGLSRLIVT